MLNDIDLRTDLLRVEWDVKSYTLTK